MIVEDHDMSDRLATYGYKSRLDREDLPLSSRCCIRQTVASNHHHSFLKRSKIDISQNVKFLRHALRAAWAILAMTSCYQLTTHAHRHTAIRQTSGLSIVNPTAMLETTGPANCLSVEIGTRSKRNFQRPESNCGVAINSGCEIFI